MTAVYTEEVNQRILNHVWKLQFYAPVRWPRVFPSPEFTAFLSQYEQSSAHINESLNLTYKPSLPPFSFYPTWISAIKLQLRPIRDEISTSNLIST